MIIVFQKGRGLSRPRYHSPLKRRVAWRGSMLSPPRPDTYWGPLAASLWPLHHLGAWPTMALSSSGFLLSSVQSLSFPSISSWRHTLIYNSKAILSSHFRLYQVICVYFLLIHLKRKSNLCKLLSLYNFTYCFSVAWELSRWWCNWKMVSRIKFLYNGTLPQKTWGTLLPQQNSKLILVVVTMINHVA